MFVIRWLSRYGKDTFRAWDFWTAAACAAGTSALAFITAVQQSAQAVLFAEAAVGTAMTATVLAALAIFATCFDGSYRLVLEKAGNSGTHSCPTRLSLSLLPSPL